MSCLTFSFFLFFFCVCVCCASVHVFVCCVDLRLLYLYVQTCDPFVRLTIGNNEQKTKVLWYVVAW